jgi:hypothetical protein
MRRTSSFSCKFLTDADCIKGRKAPGKKSKALVLQAAIDDAGGVLPRAGAGGAMSIVGTMGGEVPVKKAPNAPALQAAIDDAGGVLPRAGAGGAMSVVGLMHAGCTSGSARGVLPAKAALSSIETLRCGLLERARRAVGGLAKTAAIIDRAPFG